MPENVELIAAQIDGLRSDLLGLRRDLGEAGTAETHLFALDRAIDFAAEVALEARATAIRADTSLTPAERSERLNALFWDEDDEEGEEDSDGERQVDQPSWDLGSVIGDLAALRGKAPQIAAEVTMLLARLEEIHERVARLQQAQIAAALAQAEAEDAAATD